MSDEIYVDCPHCDIEQEFPAFFIKVGCAFGLVGIVCSDCGETVPGEAILDAVEEQDVEIDADKIAEAIDNERESTD